MAENGATRCDGGSFPLSEIAVSQLCGKLQIPMRYYRRLPAEMQAVVANYDLGRQNGKSFLLRGKGEWIRAFLSAEYVAYNNSEIAQTAESLLRNEPLGKVVHPRREPYVFEDHLRGHSRR